MKCNDGQSKHTRASRWHISIWYAKQQQQQHAPIQTQAHACINHMWEGDALVGCASSGGGRAQQIIAPWIWVGLLLAPRRRVVKNAAATAAAASEGDVLVVLRVGGWRGWVGEAMGGNVCKQPSVDFLAWLLRNAYACISLCVLSRSGS